MFVQSNAHLEILFMIFDIVINIIRAKSYPSYRDESLRVVTLKIHGRI